MSTMLFDARRKLRSARPLDLVAWVQPDRRAGRRASCLPASRYSIGVHVPSSPTPLSEYVPATSPFSSNSMAPDAPS